MQIQHPSTETYVLWQVPEAIQRLLKQGQFLNLFTRQVFEEAGITAGMNVLGLGCGPGDVSLIVAELVGKTSRVLGVERLAARLRTEIISCNSVARSPALIAAWVRKSRDTAGVAGRGFLEMPPLETHNVL